MFDLALNRGNRREPVLPKPADSDAFIEAIADACLQLSLNLFGYCLMSNPFHPVLRTQGDGDLGRWLRWWLTAHAQQYHRH